MGWSQCRECIAAGNFPLHEIDIFRALLFDAPFSSGCRVSVHFVISCVEIITRMAAADRRYISWTSKEDKTHTHTRSFRSTRNHSFRAATQPNGELEREFGEGRGTLTVGMGWNIFTNICFYSDVRLFFSSVASFVAFVRCCVFPFVQRLKISAENLIWFVFHFAHHSTCYAHTLRGGSDTRLHCSLRCSTRGYHLFVFLRYRMNYSEYSIKWLRSIASTVRECAQSQLLSPNKRCAAAKFNLNSIIIH